MTWLTRIVALLNIIAAGALIYFALQVIEHRRLWAKEFERQIQQRDGIPTQQVLSSLSEEEREKLKQLLGDYLQKSEYAQLKGAAAVQFDAMKTKPPQDPKLLDLIKKLGPDVYRKLVEDYIVAIQATMLAEENKLIARRAALQLEERGHQAQIKYYDEQIARFLLDEKREKELLAKAVVESEARRLELTQRYAELEEALAARNVARGRLRDVEDRLAAQRTEFDRLAAENQSLAEKIRLIEERLLPK